MAIYVPSFWDYLAQAGQQGLNSYQQSKESAEARAARQRAEALQGLQFTQGLEQQGVVPYTQVNQQMQQLSSQLPWLQGVQMQGPSQGGLRAQIANTPDSVPQLAPLQVQNMPSGVQSPIAPTPKPSAPPPQMQRGIDQYTDAQRQYAGLPTRAQQEKEQLGLEASRFGLSAAKSNQTYEEGMRPIERLAKLDPVMKSAAEAYVAGELNRSGGRIDPNKLDMMSEAAFKRFVSDKRGAEILQMSPDQVPLARAQFDRALRNALNEQMDRDLRKQIAALQASGRNGVNPATIGNMLANLASKAELSAKNMQAELPPWLRSMTALSSDQLSKVQLSDDAKLKLSNIAAQHAAADQLRQAAAGYASGVVSPEQAQQMLLDYMNNSIGGTGQAPQGAQAPAAEPKPKGMSVDGKKQITPDQEQYLKAIGKWDASKYEVVR